MQTANHYEYVQQIIKSPSRPCDSLTEIRVDGYTGTWCSVLEYAMKTDDGFDKFYLMKHEQEPTVYYNILLNYALILVAEELEV